MVYSLTIIIFFYTTRYKGKKISRKDVYGSDNESEDEDNSESLSHGSDKDDSIDSASEDQGSEIDEEVGNSASEDQDSEVGTDAMNSHSEDDNSDEASGSDEEEDESEIDVDNPLRRERREDTNFNHMTEENVRSDVEKGNCVREQLKIWENLLEVRIKLQKCLIASNKMPQSETYGELRSDEQFRKESDESKSRLTGLLEGLLEIQSGLLGNYPETKNLRVRGKKRKAENDNEPEVDDPMDEEILSDSEDDEAAECSDDAEKEPEKKKKKRNLAEYESLLAENHRVYRDYRNSVIQKWNDKTRVAAGSVNKGSSQAVVKQIEFVMSDKSKLLKRTQLKRSEYEIVGKSETEAEDGRRTQEYDTEIYDDDDFYHQLLRELIEFKSSDITDPIQLSKQWIQLQNMRSKMKRKIDTRATKGRRVRYNVHTKLVNFMAPIGVSDNWSDLAKNELYNSLFGKINRYLDRNDRDSVP